MRKVLLLITLIAFFSTLSNAQNVGVGTNMPDPSAKLDVVATNGGILIPRVNLTGPGDLATIPNPATGLMVWNTGASWGTPGFYYNTGTTVSPSWVKVLDSASSVDDADADPANEIQTLSQAGTTVTLSGGGGSISTADNDNDPANEIQNLSNIVSGTNRTINISGGTGTSFSVADNDNDPANEIQNLSIAGSTISLSDGGGSVTVPSSADNLGNHSATSTLLMNNNWINIKNDVTTNPGNIGISWHGGNTSYSIYQESGTWTNPYPDLMIRFHTGLKLSAESAYGGVSVYAGSGESLTSTFNASGQTLHAGTLNISTLSGAGTRMVTVDNSGNFSATTLPSGDNLGNHLATTNLNINNYEVDNVSFLDVRPGNGYGIRFWSENNYAINMGNAAEYLYGSVTDYSIKMNMNNVTNRGWTFGADGVQPGLAINTQGHLTMKGALFLDCPGCGSTSSAYGGTSDWGDLVIQGRVLSSNSNLHLSPPSGSNVVINDTYRAGGGSGGGAAGLQVQGVTQSDQGFNVDGNTVIDDGAGWHRSYGATGWYNQTYAGGWYMTDGTYIRAYNNKAITYGPGAYSTASLWGGYQYGNSTSDGHRLLPNANEPGATGWGYVGQSNTDWYYMYADNFTNTSARAKKKDITPVDPYLMEYIVDDIRNIETYFYRYKSETTEMEAGNEPKYRPNMHLGVILEDSPDYLKDQAFSGIDIYAMGVFALTGVKYILNELDQLKTTNNSKIMSGQGEILSESNVVIEFNEGFEGIDAGQVPLVNITPTSPNSGFYLSDISQQGFTVNGEDGFTFNWLAQSVPDINQPGQNSKTMIQPGLLESLEVSDDKKQMIKDYWERDKQKMRAEYMIYLQGLSEDNPDLYNKILQENSRGQ